MSSHSRYPAATFPKGLVGCSMEDVWDDEAASEPSESRKVQREHENAGYLEGITHSKELSLQPGFDEGYQEGAAIGLRAGRIIGTFQAMGLGDLETAALKSLSPKALFSFQYYNSNAEPLFQGSDHPLLLEWESRLAAFSDSSKD